MSNSHAMARLKSSATETMPREIVLGWGWRIPFFAGCFIIPLIFFLRRTLEETPDFLALKRRPTARDALPRRCVEPFIHVGKKQRLA
ncbi:hypothetical protein NLM33_37450 [Bradyrhizobium sp. CCGUVB1N3]|nr:hypothetical protein [Bradyrhizobium sp. CCGUVB1N3]